MGKRQRTAALQAAGVQAEPPAELPRRGLTRFEDLSNSSPGQTQAEFAGMIGASKDALVSWELGRNPLSDLDRIPPPPPAAQVSPPAVSLTFPLAGCGRLHASGCSDTSQVWKPAIRQTGMSALRGKCQDALAAG